MGPATIRFDKHVFWSVAMIMHGSAPSVAREYAPAGSSLGTQGRGWSSLPLSGRTQKVSMIASLWDM
jgi:hypothetical protein